MTFCGVEPLMYNFLGRMGGLTFIFLGLRKSLKEIQVFCNFFHLHYPYPIMLVGLHQIIQEFPRA